MPAGQDEGNAIEPLSSILLVQENLIFTLINVGFLSVLFLHDKLQCYAFILQTFLFNRILLVFRFSKDLTWSWT